MPNLKTNTLIGLKLLSYTATILILPSNFKSGEIFANAVMKCYTPAKNQVAA